MKASNSKTNRNIPQGKKSFLSRRTVLLSAVGAVSGAAAIGGATGVFSPNAEPVANRGNVTLYKNPQCDCCEGYADYLRHNGFEVKVIPTNDLTIMGEKYGIPDSLQPCHLSLMAGYVVGGHIPMEVIDRLLSEKPQITGITLPGMPQGTPGMPGKKPDRLTVYAIVKGSPPKVYATI
jgi:hypothetical protein